MSKYTTRTSYKQLDSKFLLVDHSYQRSLDMGRVRKIVENFGPLTVNLVKVSKRSDGSYYIFDGQHTTAALKERAGGDVPVDCIVFEFLHVSDAERQKIEATLFAEQNGISRAVPTSDKLKAEFTAGNADVIQFYNLTKAAGVRMDFTKGTGENKLICCGEAYKAYQKLNASHYVAMLQMIRETWGGEKDSFRREIVGGVTILVSCYPNQYKHKTFVKQLCKTSPIKIIRDGNLSTESGNRKYMEQMVQVYNKGLRKGKLE